MNEESFNHSPHKIPQENNFPSRGSIHGISYAPNMNQAMPHVYPYAISRYPSFGNKNYQMHYPDGFHQPGQEQLGFINEPQNYCKISSLY